jgi:hypothetical protein
MNTEVRNFPAERKKADGIKWCASRRTFYADEVVYHVINALRAHDEGDALKHNHLLFQAKEAARQVMALDVEIDKLNEQEIPCAPIDTSGPGEIPFL